MPPTYPSRSATRNGASTGLSAVGPDLEVAARPRARPAPAPGLSRLAVATIGAWALVGFLGGMVAVLAIAG